MVHNKVTFDSYDQGLCMLKLADISINLMQIIEGLN